MAEGDLELQHTANRALEKAENAGSAVQDLQRELKCATEELGYLKTFSGKLLKILELKFGLKYGELDALILRAEEAEASLEEKPGSQKAELCSFCGRPLQKGRTACIYCGRAIT